MSHPQSWVFPEGSTVSGLGGEQGTIIIKAEANTATIEGGTFQDAVNGDGNASAIYYENSALTLINVTALRCQDGVRGTSNKRGPDGSFVRTKGFVFAENLTVDGCGFGGKAHGVYLDSDLIVLKNFLGKNTTGEGHTIKARFRTLWITGRIEAAINASRMFDFFGGGTVYMSGDWNQAGHFNNDAIGWRLVTDPGAQPPFEGATHAIRFADNVFRLNPKGVLVSAFPGQEPPTEIFGRHEIIQTETPPAPPPEPPAPPPEPGTEPAFDEIPLGEARITDSNLNALLPLTNNSNPATGVDLASLLFTYGGGCYVPSEGWLYHSGGHHTNKKTITNTWLGAAAATGKYYIAREADNNLNILTAAPLRNGVAITVPRVDAAVTAGVNAVNATTVSITVDTGTLQLYAGNSIAWGTDNKWTMRIASSVLITGPTTVNIALETGEWSRVVTAGGEAIDLNWSDWPKNYMPMMHTYSSLTYMPTVGKIMVGGAAASYNGAWYPFPESVAGTSKDGMIWWLDPITGVPEAQKGENVPSFNNRYGLQSVWDNAHGCVWVTVGGWFSVWKYVPTDPIGSRWTEFPGALTRGVIYRSAAWFDESHGYMVLNSENPGYLVIDCSTGIPVQKGPHLPYQGVNMPIGLVGFYNQGFDIDALQGSAVWTNGKAFHALHGVHQYTDPALWEWEANVCTPGAGVNESRVPYYSKALFATDRRGVMGLPIYDLTLPYSYNARFAIAKMPWA